MIISVSLDLLSPQITKRIIDDVIGGGQIQLLTKLLLGILLVGVGRCIFQYLKEYTFDYVWICVNKVDTKSLTFVFYHQAAS